MKLTADSAKALAILAGVAVVGFALWKIYSTGSAVAQGAATFVTETINPLSTENAVYRMFETRDDKGEVTSTLGGDIYDAVHHSDGSFRWPWEDPH